MFKKSLSMILTLLMVFSCMGTMIFTASAGDYTPEGTPITQENWSTIANNLSGKYYLTEDITVTKQLSGTFLGTLDGMDTNGVQHTIKTSVPIFFLMGGTVKNLTITGSISVASGFCASVCAGTAVTNTPAVFSNVTNEVDFTVTGGGVCTGGFIGQANSPVEFTDCINKGTITVTHEANSQNYVGGFIGRFGNNYTYTNPTKFVRCANEAAITVTSKGNALVGGFVGWYYTNNDYTFDTCTNSGNINTSANTGATCKAGGLIGVCDKPNTHTYINCTNSGQIDAYNIAAGLAGQDSGIVIAKNCTNDGAINIGRTAAVQTGGMIGTLGYATANEDLFNIFEGCTNLKNIKSTSTSTTTLMGGIVGNSAAKIKTVYKDCVNSGDIGSDTAGGGVKVGGIVGVDTSASPKFISCVNYGDISATKAAGGIAGNLGSATTFIACVNRGDITIKDGLANNDYAAGGIGGYCNVVNTVYQCVNYGAINGNNTKVPASMHTAGIIAKSTTASTFNFCENFGEVTGQEKGKTAEIAPDGTLTNCGQGNESAVSLDFEGVQRSVAVENETTFSLRFVSKITEINKYKTTGVMVYVTTPGSKNVKYTNSYANEVYSQINNGIQGMYPVQKTEGVYYSALTVTDISVVGTHNFIVVPYTVDLDGNYAYADAYTVTVTDGGAPSIKALAPAPAV